jgi:hypothetical protein
MREHAARPLDDIAAADATPSSPRCVACANIVVHFLDISCTCRQADVSDRCWSYNTGQHCGAKGSAGKREALLLQRGLYPSNRGCSPTTPCAVNRRSRQANSRITHVPQVTKNAHPSLAATCAVVQNLQAETGAPTNWGPWGTTQTPNTPLAQNNHTQPCMHPSASMHRKLACAQYSTQPADMRRAQMRLRLHIRGHQKSPGAAQHDRVTGACTQLHTVC